MRCSKMTKPAVGRDLLSRFSITVVSARSVSPIKTGFGMVTSVIAEIGDQRAERRVADRKADHEREGEEAVDDDPAEFAVAGIFGIEMQRLRIMGQRGHQQIIGLGHRAMRIMAEDLRRLSNSSK